MVHPAVENQEFFPAGDLDIVHPGEVNACLADQKAAGLDQEPCAVERRISINPGEELRQARPQRFKVQLVLVRKVGNPQATAKIERAKGLSCALSDAARDTETVTVLAHKDRAFQDLRAGEEVDSPEIERRIR